MSKIYAAKANHVTNPMGFYMDSITFSWKVKSSKGKEQRTARILISEDKSFNKICFDTDESQLDNLGTKIQFDMKARTRYFWKVILLTDENEKIESDIQYFETGKMKEAWYGKWITCNDNQGRHPLFMKKIHLKDKVNKARLYICGLGLYEAYFKGEKSQKSEKIGEEYLTPYCNNYDQWIQYQTFDVTDQLVESGVLSVLLGNGWYKGRFGFSDPTKKSIYGEDWKLIIELHIDYCDGSHEIIASDEKWLVTKSNIFFSNIYDGEKRDDTLIEESATPAVLAKAPRGKLMERLSLPIKVQKRIKPIKLIHTPRNEWVFDLGQEITGIFELRVNEPRNTIIKIQTGEILQDGCFYNDNLRTALSEYVYVSDGEEKVITPHFTYYGYRYVKISGIDQLTCEDFTALVLYSDYESIGEIETGNALVNKLISNVTWGMRGNFLDVPTDCPQRDERMGWTGDAQVFSATASYLADTYAFYRKYLYDLYQEQLHLNGMVPEIVPSFGTTKTSSAWGDAACIIPWNMYLFSGDQSILEEQLDSMKAWVDYIQRVDGQDHGWRKVFHYGDWLALDRVGSATNSVYGATDEAYIADIYYAVSAQIVAKSAEILELEEIRLKYQRIADNQKQIIQKEYFTSTGRCAVNTQTGLILALKHQLSSNVELTKQMLRKLLRNNKNKLNTGFVGTPLLCNVLTEHDMEDLSYQLLLNEEYPGWLYEVKLGATTVWERWNSLDKDGHVSSTGMNSLNHYSYGAVLEWIFKHAAGIQLLEEYPGARMIKIAPKVNAELGFVNANYDSAAGLYQSGWKVLEKNKLHFKFTVPFGASAQIVLPYAPQSLFADKSNPLFHTVLNGVCHVKSGVYEVIYEATELLKKKYSVDSTVDELLSNPKIYQFLSRMMEVDMIPDFAYSYSLRNVAKIFAKEMTQEEVIMLNSAFEQY